MEILFFYDHKRTYIDWKKNQIYVFFNKMFNMIYIVHSFPHGEPLFNKGDN